MLFLIGIGCAFFSTTMAGLGISRNWPTDDWRFKTTVGAGLLGAFFILLGLAGA